MILIAYQANYINDKKTIPSLPDLNQSQLSLFAARVAHMLTIFARDTYDDDGVSVRDPLRLRAYNEVMHRMLAAIIDSISGENISGAIRNAYRLLPRYH